MSAIAHFTLDHYEHMVELGVFSGAYEQRLELIRGEIRQMSPIGYIHSHVVTHLTDWSYEVVPRERIVIRVQNPVRIPASDSEPHPDLVWAMRNATVDHHPNPEDVLLLIEVADTSLADDRTEKLEIYAEAGIQEYWIVNVIDEQIEVHRQPIGRTYQQRTVYGANASVCPLALPTATLQPSRLFT